MGDYDGDNSWHAKIKTIAPLGALRRMREISPLHGFNARCNIYISRLCYDVSIRRSVCLSVSDGSALWSRCMPGRGQGSSRAMLATARPSC